MIVFSIINHKKGLIISTPQFELLKLLTFIAILEPYLKFAAVTLLEVKARPIVIQEASL